MPRSSICPDAAALEQTATNPPPLAELKPLLEHLAGCESCVAQLAALPDRVKLVERIEQAQARLTGAGREAVGRLLERLRRPSAAVMEERTLPPLPPATPPSFACPRCGKMLRAKPDSAGKRLKCPHCKEAIAVPTVAPAAIDYGTVAPPPAPERGPTATPTPVLSSKELEYTDFLAPPQTPDEIGRLGPYRVLAVLGAGGMGVVFRAEDPQLKRPIALKAMLPALAASGTAKLRFVREAQAAAAIKHDHIVSIYQVGEDRGAPFLAMEFLDGESLDSRLKREGTLPVPELVRIAREIAEGLDAAHERGLVHRDIKPANIWLEGKRARAKILDFGLARDTADDAHLTQSGAIVGTPAYMSPEQAQGKVADARCDLFSLGCVLYRMATGDTPFKGSDTISTLMAVATENPTAPGELDSRLPRALSDLIMWLLAKKPADRPASARAVVEALEAIPLKPTAGWPMRIAVRRQAPRRTPLLIAAGAGAGIVLLIALLLGLYVFRPSAAPVAPAVAEAPPPGQPAKPPPPAPPDAAAAKPKVEFATPPPKAAAPQLPFDAIAVRDPDPGFLTNDLAGWEGDMDIWTHKDGVLHGTAPLQAGNYNTFLCSKKKYRDFELEFDVLVKEGRGETGVLLRGDMLNREKFEAKGPVCTMTGPWTCSLDAGRFGGLMQMSEKDLVEKVRKPAEFNHVYLRYVGRRVAVVLNGLVVLDRNMLTFPDEGILAWQFYPSGSQDYTYRNIRFRDLSSAPAAKQGTLFGPDTDAFRPLFNGKDLAGWDPNGEAKINKKGTWSVVDGAIKVEGTQGLGWLGTTARFDDFEVELEYRLPKRGISGLLLRAGVSHQDTFLKIMLNDDSAIEFPDPKTWTGSLPRKVAADPLVKTQPKQWHKLRARAEGQHIQVWLNDIKVLDTMVDYRESTGALGLEYYTTPAEFRNIRVRYLPSHIGGTFRLAN